MFFVVLFTIGLLLIESIIFPFDEADKILEKQKAQTNLIRY